MKKIVLMVALLGTLAQGGCRPKNAVQVLVDFRNHPTLLSAKSVGLDLSGPGETPCSALARKNLPCEVRERKQEGLKQLYVRALSSSVAAESGKPYATEAVLVMFVKQHHAIAEKLTGLCAKGTAYIDPAHKDADDPKAKPVPYYPKVSQGTRFAYHSWNCDYVLVVDEEHPG